MFLNAQEPQYHRNSLEWLDWSSSKSTFVHPLKNFLTLYSSFISSPSTDQSKAMFRRADKTISAFADSSPNPRWLNLTFALSNQSFLYAYPPVTLWLFIRNPNAASWSTNTLCWSSAGSSVGLITDTAFDLSNEILNLFLMQDIELRQQHPELWGKIQLH